MEIRQRIEALRKILKEKNLNGYIVTGLDPHLGEYQGERWKTRKFITGFTGSAGTALITQDEALLWVDSRYYIQAAEELKGTEIKMIKSGEGDSSFYGYLEKIGGKIGICSSSVSIAAFNAIKRRGVGLVKTEDLLSYFWPDRPLDAGSEIYPISDEDAGEVSEEKIKRVRARLKEMGAEWTFISSLDDIAWLTNLRASDIAYTPVFLSWCFISQKEALLFLDEKRLTKDAERIKRTFRIYPESEVFEVVKERAEGKGFIDERKTNTDFMFLAEKAIKGRDITNDFKTRKNESEIEGMRKAHIADAAAFITFLSKLDRKKRMKEGEISLLLEKEREKNPAYIGPSFSPISASGKNGAVVHYNAKGEGEDVKGLLVLDTGSQYSFGTTDITRTLLFGTARKEEKRAYTLVLKGHLALIHSVFIKGTTGVQLDALAKQYLWKEGMSYFHGTGHGVGHVLSVHEGPVRISSALIDVPLEKGMVISCEPGVYKEGRFGIRIENLIAVKEKGETEFGLFYEFENLTLVPYERSLIDKSLLTEEEIEWINSYYRQIREKTKAYLDKTTFAYLEKETERL